MKAMYSRSVRTSGDSSDASRPDRSVQLLMSLRELESVTRTDAVISSIRASKDRSETRRSGSSYMTATAACMS